MLQAAWECFWVSLKLGMTSFGGPVAHLGYFREVYVERREWLKEEEFAELLALTQFLPGPGSSQLGAAIGYERAGWAGAFAAWLGFTLPSAVLMILFAMGVELVGVGEDAATGWLSGLKIAAIAVVAIACLGMRKSLCPRLPEQVLALAALLILVLFSSPIMQPLVIFLGAILGALFWTEKSQPSKPISEVRVTKSGGVRSLAAYVGLTVIVIIVLFLLPWVLLEQRDARIWTNLYGAGALVFGGGHVVLPLLEVNTVDQGLLKQDVFLAGYGAAQAMPGPLFTFGGFLGASMNMFANPWLGGFAGIVALFLPGMLLLAGGLPLWNALKNQLWARAAVRGANAAVVGVLAAVLVKIILNGEVSGVIEWSMLVAVAAAIYFKCLPVWVIVALSALIGFFVIR
ncbi:MAG: chromate efflux transporter [Akkermansiaceae bacterium]